MSSISEKKENILLSNRKYKTSFLIVANTSISNTEKNTNEMFRFQ